MSLIPEESKAQLRRLMELRDKRDETKIAADKAEHDYREAEADAFEALKDIKGAIKVDLGAPWGETSFRSREQHFAQIINEDEMLAYYENRAMIDEITTAKPRMKVLNEHVRDAREQGLDPPPGLGWTTRRGVTITRQKG